MIHCCNRSSEQLRIVNGYIIRKMDVKVKAKCVLLCDVCALEREAALAA